MGKIAFLFAGQGAQTPGMGHTLYESHAASRTVFEQAEQLRPGTMMQMFEGSAEVLSITENTQPCVYTADLAAARALEEQGIVPDAVAGFSLGELAALTFAGVFTDADGFTAVCRRAEYMHAAAQNNPGGMAAVLRMDPVEVGVLCKAHGVYPVNYNCPGQLVVAGERAALASFVEAAATKRARCVPIAVSGAFHSPLMKEASQAFAVYLGDVSVCAPRIPVYANATGAPYGGDASAMRALTARQIESPVLWQKTIEQMAVDGFDTFVEVGPGRVLSGLVRKTLPDAHVYAVQEAADVVCVCDALKGERHADR